MPWWRIDEPERAFVLEIHRLGEADREVEREDVLDAVDDEVGRELVHAGTMERRRPSGLENGNCFAWRAGGELAEVFGHVGLIEVAHRAGEGCEAVGGLVAQAGEGLELDDRALEASDAGELLRGEADAAAALAGQPLARPAGLARELGEGGCGGHETCDRVIGDGLPARRNAREQPALERATRVARIDREVEAERGQVELEIGELVGVDAQECGSRAGPEANGDDAQLGSWGDDQGAGHRADDAGAGMVAGELDQDVDAAVREDAAGFALRRRWRGIVRPESIDVRRERGRWVVLAVHRMILPREHARLGDGERARTPGDGDDPGRRAVASGCAASVRHGGCFTRGA